MPKGGSMRREREAGNTLAFKLYFFVLAGQIGASSLLLHNLYCIDFIIIGFDSLVKDRPLKYVFTW